MKAKVYMTVERTEVFEVEIDETEFYEWNAGGPLDPDSVKEFLLSSRDESWDPITNQPDVIGTEIERVDL